MSAASAREGAGPVAAGSDPQGEAVDAEGAELGWEPDPGPGGADPVEVERRSAIVDAGAHGQRLDRVLVGMAPEFSRSHLQTLVRDGHVRLDGRVELLPSRRVHAGQQLQVELVPTAESRAYMPQPMALAIVHEDEHLLVLDKPAGLVVHPAAGNWSGTLLNGLLAHHAGAAQLPRAGVVHRLDKDTSGLMVVGKTLAAVTALVRAIAARQVLRRYRALAHGVVDPAERRIDAPIGRDPASRIRMTVLAGGRPARTDVRCLAVCAEVSALECTLHTGRTHQIRVHLAHIGHPLLADRLYGGAPALGLQRQALHAARLQFVHPGTGRVMAFDAPPPADFEAAWVQVVGASAETGRTRALR
jgi:23S rRNA pseudouridine1911/1915/1917 synthase